MGRQVNFYMAHSDEGQFVDFLTSDRHVWILGYTSATQEITPLSMLPKLGEPFSFSVWLWDRDNSPQPVLKFVPKQRYYVVDRFVSEVIEFSRSHIDEGRLVRGRIWAQMDIDSNEGLVPVSESFRKWYSRLARWIK